MTDILNWTAAAFAVVTATGLLLSRDWRWSLCYLAVHYLSVFWLVRSHLPISMAAAKLVTGWMVCAILGITLINSSTSSESDTSWPQGRLFRAFAAAFALAVTVALATRAVPWLSIDLPVALGGLFFLGMGLLLVGMTDQSFRVVLGILTFLSGFEILYAGVESSILVAALLTAINLGLALAGAYFLISGATEITQ